MFLESPNYSSWHLYPSSNISYMHELNTNQNILPVAKSAKSTCRSMETISLINFIMVKVWAWWLLKHINKKNAIERSKPCPPYVISIYTKIICLQGRSLTHQTNTCSVVCEIFQSFPNWLHPCLFECLIDS